MSTVRTGLSLLGRIAFASPSDAHAAVEHAIKRLRLEAEATIRDRIEAVLAAPRIESADAQWLGHRDRSAFARCFLFKFLPFKYNGHNGSILPTLCEPYMPAHILRWRLALAFGLAGHRKPPPDLTANTSPQAQCVRALVGEAVSWDGAAREVRAALLLRAVVDAMRNGSGPC